MKAADVQQPVEKVIKTNLWFTVQNNSKFVRGKSKSKDDIKQFVLPRYNATQIDERNYEVSFFYKTQEDLDEQIYDMLDEMHWHADMRNCFVEAHVISEDGDQSW